MSDKVKNIVIVVLFLGLIIGFALANLLAPDAEVSYSERRTLAKAPEFNAEKLMNGELSEEYGEYMEDQFVLRDAFRTLKAINEYYIFAKRDNNGIYIKDGYVSKLEYPLDENCIENAKAMFDGVYNTLFEGFPAYYSVIPDKNYFLAEKNGYPSMDYEKLISLLGDGTEFGYADITELLSIENYYKTDLHWRQEAIIPVADVLLSAMGKELPAREYEARTLAPFYGLYFGQSALPVGADKLVYLTNDVLDKCTLYNPITKNRRGMYCTEEFGGMDSYNLFLTGPASLLVLENPSNPDGDTLYLLRDSFGSSIAPLLIEAYSEIVLIDMRYISPDEVAKYINTSEKGDVLFLLSALILNKSYLFK